MTERGRSPGMNPKEAHGYFRDLGEILRAEPDEGPRVAFLSGERAGTQYQQAKNALVNQVFDRRSARLAKAKSEPVVQKETESRERLSDAELGGLLAAVGNHEGKALLLASMKPDVGYSLGGLRDLVAIPGQKLWDDSLPFVWCNTSMAPIGLVVKNTVTDEFEITQRGIERGVALAGHLKRLSEDYQHVSLRKLLGQTSAPNSVESEARKESEDKKRAPITRFRIIKELIESDEPRRLEDIAGSLTEKYPADYPDKGAAMPSLSNHIDNLTKGGIISSRSAEPDAAVVTFSAAVIRPSEPLGPYRTQKLLTQRIDSYVSEAGGPVTLQAIYEHLVATYPQYSGLKQKNLMPAISGVAQHLVRNGYARQEGVFQNRSRSIITLTDVQRESLAEFVQIVEDFRGLDRDFLQRGRQSAKEIVEDPERFAKVMQKARDVAIYRNEEETVTEIMGFLHDNPDKTNRDIQSYFAGQGIHYTLSRIQELTKSLMSNNKIRGVKQGKSYRFTVDHDKDEDKDKPRGVSELGIRQEAVTVVVDPREKPIELFYLPHEERKYALLEQWDEKIRAALTDHPTGKLVVFTELANGTLQFTNAIRQRVANGIMPTDAWVEANIEQRYPNGVDEPSREAVEDQVRRESATGFMLEATTRLDEIAFDFPGRIDWVVEGRDESTSLPVADEDIKAAYSFIQTHLQEPPSAENMQVYRESVELIAQQDRARDDLIAKQIAEAVQEDDVIGCVGWVGTKHTPISHQLIRDRYTVRRRFPEAEEGTVTFAPITTLLRQAQLQPENEITDTDIRLATSLSQPVFDFDPDATDQQLFQAAHKWMREQRAQADEESAIDDNYINRSTSASEAQQPEMQDISTLYGLRPQAAASPLPETHTKEQPRVDPPPMLPDE